MIIIGKSFSLECAHTAQGAQDERNRRIHGHSYVITLFWEATTCTSQGFQLNLEDDADREIYKVRQTLDHRMLNDVLGVHATMEALAEYIGKLLSPGICMVRVERPTVGMICEWRRE